MGRPADDAKRLRKEALQRWKDERRRASRASLPLDDDAFQAFFDALDRSLVEHGCDHTRRLSEAILAEQGRSESVERVFAWFDAHSGYCDCEVLANVEEVWRSTL